MKQILTVIISVIISSSVFSQFPVIGYVHSWGMQPPDFNKISFEKLTHINIAFVNPDSSGNLLLTPAFDSLIQKAHLYKLKVLASLGGGTFNPYYAALLSDSSRNLFINALLQLTVNHNLDGIDVDLEGNNIDENYQKFIVELSGKLKKKKKLLTAALATWNAEKITNVALNKFDFINVMSYDQTGPWRPNDAGPHSTFEKAVEDLDYWTNTRRIPKNKVNLGLPFYGYGFGTKNGTSMSYDAIVSNFADAENLDSIAPPDGGKIFYNGLETIKRKTDFALKNAGGIMIWEITQDTSGDKSLLDAIDNVIKKSGKKRIKNSKGK